MLREYHVDQVEQSLDPYIGGRRPVQSLLYVSTLKGCDIPGFCLTRLDLAQSFEFFLNENC